MGFFYYYLQRSLKWPGIFLVILLSILTFHIANVEAAPVADFTGTPTAGGIPLTVNFTDISTGTITDWSWSFGDGGTSSVQNPSYTYTSAGSYTVSLTVTASDGSATQTKTNYIIVYAAPVANFSGSPLSGDIPLAVAFTDSSTGFITGWSWSFGDGSTSTAQNPSYTYNTVGTFTVTLTVTGPGGSDTLQRVNYVSAGIVHSSVFPASYYFGNFMVGSSSTAKTFTISSTGTANLIVGTITLAGANASEFSMVNDNCSGQIIAPNNSCTIQAVFSPTSTGVKSANLTIPSNAPTLNVPLSGESVPDISVTPANYNFQKVDLGNSSTTQTFIVNSTGTSDLVIGTITLTGTNASEFSKLNDNCSGQTIAPNSSCTIQAVFSPRSVGAKTANLSIPSNAVVSQKLVLLSGIGKVPGEVQWVRTYGGTGEDYVESVQQTLDGGYIAAGGTSSFGARVWAAWVLKLDVDGNVQWQNGYGDNSSYFYVHSIQKTSDGGYIVAGSRSIIMRGSEAWIMKLDGSGNVQWQMNYGGTANDHAQAIQQTSDGGYIVAGDTASFGAGGSDAWILKLDSGGNVQWAKAYGDENDDSARSILQTQDGGYVVAGERSTIIGSSYPWIWKLDSNGNMQWQAFGDMSVSNGSAESIQKTLDGGYIAAGWINHSDIGDAWVLKLDGNGNVQWAKAVGGNGYNSAYSVQQISDGGYIVTGLTGSFGAGGTDAWIFKLDGNGNLQGQKTYGGSGNDYAYAIQLTSDGGYVIAGESGSLSAGGSDAWVLKLDAAADIPAFPACGAIVTSGATAKNTYVAVTATPLTGTDTAVTPQTVAVSTKATNAMVTEACPYEEDDSAITYTTGTWISRPFSSCSGGALRYSCETGAKAEFSFNGTGIKWIVTKARMGGKAKACLDGTVMCKTVDLYSPTTRFQQIIQKTGLTPGQTHTVTIEVLGQKNPAATNQCIDIDAFMVVH